MSKVDQALQRSFPHGVRRCLPLAADATDIHMRVPYSTTLFYPSTGPTSQLRHQYVFYAGVDSSPAPEFVQFLSSIRILHKKVVDATTDIELRTERPIERLPNGAMSAVAVYRHVRRTFPVDIYETEPQDGRFSYSTRAPGSGGAFEAGNFPSRMYDGGLPPFDQHYRLPVVEPYALSVVAAACFPETVADIANLRQIQGWDGSAQVLADVTFNEHPLPWMLTPAFSRAALGGATESIEQPRTLQLQFKVVGDKLVYVGGLGQP